MGGADPSDVLNGRLDVPDGLSSKVIRVFLSSTFTDTMNERNRILGEAAPQLKAYAKRLGFTFQVATMRWGVTKKHGDTHQVADLCRNEIFACQRISDGYNFVSFLGQKYGYRPFPHNIQATELDALMRVMSEEDKELVQKWFRLDDNSDPSSYELLPISQIYPDYINEQDQALASEAAGKWWNDFSQMQKALRAASVAAELPTERQHVYVRSVTEEETEIGLGEAEDPNKAAIWFRRTLTDLSSHTSDPAARKYMDLSENVVDEDAQAQLKRLTDTFMPGTGFTNVKTYDIQWAANKGVSEDTHKEYLDQICSDFIAAMKENIDFAASTASALNDDSIYVEVAQQANICRDKYQGFYGRKPQLESIAQYLSQPGDTCLVIHAKSGAGKTCLMAEAARAASAAHPNAVLVTRFIGTTQNSSAGLALVNSICAQLGRVLKPSEATIVPAVNLADSGDKLKGLLQEATEERPIILFLDSLDQLSPEGGGLLLRWLPKVGLPSNVHIVVSTLPEEKYVCFPQLKEAIHNEERFLTVPQLDPDDVPAIMDQWLLNNKRKLRDDQREIILNAFQDCPLPLYLKLSIQKALTWKSFEPTSDTTLDPDVRTMINGLFERLEAEHGILFVSHALAYVTASRHGLSQEEIEDLLSCDDDVLNAVFEWWVPPFRRIPPLLWARIRAQLGDFLVERGGLYAWHHRQFQEAAQARYLSTKEQQKQTYCALSDYFIGKWAEVPKPYSVKGKHAEEKRGVAAQPLLFPSATEDGTDIANSRKLEELVYCLSNCWRYRDAVDLCLSNFDWIFLRYREDGRNAILNDFEMILPHLEEKGTIERIRAVIRTTVDAQQLAFQLIGRLTNLAEHDNYLKALLEQAVASDLVTPGTILPFGGCLDPPNLQNLALLPESDKLRAVAMSRNDKYVIVGSDDRKATVYDIKDAVPVFKFSGCDWMIRAVGFNCDSTLVSYCSLSGYVYTYETETWLQVGEEVELGGHCSGMEYHPTKPTILGAVTETAILLVDVKSKKVISKYDGCGHDNGWGMGITFTTDGLLTCAVIGGTFYLLDENLHVVKSQGVRGTSLAMKADNTKVVCGGNSSIEVFNLPDGSLDNKFPIDGNCVSVAFTPDDEHVVLGFIVEGLIKMMSIATGSIVKTFQGHNDSVHAIAFSPSGIMASVGEDRMCRLWDISMPANEPQDPLLDMMVYGTQDIDTTTLPDGKHHINTNGIFDSATGAKIASLPKKMKGKPYVHGEYAYSNEWMWDLKTGKVQGINYRTLEIKDTSAAHRKTSVGSASSWTGKYTITTSKDGNAAIWLVKTEELVHDLPHMARDSDNFNRIVPGVAFSLDDKYALTGGWDCVLKLWSVETGENISSVVFDYQLNSIKPNRDGGFKIEGRKPQSENATVYLKRGKLPDSGGDFCYLRAGYINDDGDDDDESQQSKCCLVS